MIDQLRKSEIDNTSKFSAIQKASSALISTFFSHNWQSMTAFVSYTNALPPIVHVDSYFAMPDMYNFSKLDICYRPTQIQQSVAHPSVIDWVPFPSFRDRLILHHSRNPDLDAIICDIADSCACETDISKLLTGYKPGNTGYVRICDLVHCMTRSNQQQMLNAHSVQHLPAPATTALFTSPSLCSQVFRFLNKDRGLGNVHLEPMFFQRNRELQDTSVDIAAKGIPLVLPKTISRGRTLRPGAPDARMARLYAEIAAKVFVEALVN